MVALRGDELLLLLQPCELLGYTSRRCDVEQTLSAVLWQRSRSCTKPEMAPLSGRASRAQRAMNAEQLDRPASSKAHPGARGVRSVRKECLRRTFGPTL